MALRLSASIAFLIFLAGGLYRTSIAQQADPKPRMQGDLPAIVAQFCVERTRVPGHLAVFDVRRQGREPVSSGSVVTFYLGATSSGQFVFQALLGQAEDFAAAIAYPSQPHQQIFRARKTYPSEDWTDWSTPDYVSDDRNVWFKLLHGKPVDESVRVPVTALARFKISTSRRYFEEHKDIVTGGRKAELPPCPLAPNSSLQDGPAASGRAPELER